MCICPHPAAADTTCVPSASVSGDAALVADVVAHLDDMGVRDETPTGSCPRIEATVVRGDDGVTVSVRDPLGSVETRTVTDARIAATWIQSWCRTDIRAPLLLPPETSTSVAPVPATTAAVAAYPPRDAAPIAAQPVDTIDRSFTLNAVYESTSADDQTSWSGASASACVMLGGVCLGALARYAADPSASVNDGLSYGARSNAELLATAAIPFSLGRATAIPQLGVGAGRLHVERDEPAQLPEPEDPCWNMPDLMCPDPGAPPYYIGDGFTAARWGMRIETSITLSVPLASNLFLDLGASMSVSPGAHRNPFVPVPDIGQNDPTDPNGDPNDPMDPNVPPADPEPVDDYVDPMLYLPGEPEQLFRLAIGLRVGLP